MMATMEVESLDAAKAVDGGSANTHRREVGRVSRAELRAHAHRHTRNITAAL